MKKVSKSLVLAFFASLMISFAGCKKDAVIPVTELASMTTTAVSVITTTTATTGGTVTSTGGADITSRGVCWSTSHSPTVADSKTADGTGPGSFTSSIVSLTGNTIYYVRAYSTNSAGIAYGNEVNFTTSAILPIGPIIFNPDLTYGSVSDLDGNVYKTIQIGTQIWMAENLKTTKFNDQTAIPDITDNTEWESLITPGFCWYNNDESTYKGTYGALYNWYAAKTDKLCPAGWHVPSMVEWESLITYLGGGEIAAGVKVVETGNTHWLITFDGVTNETGFTGLPGGFRSISNDFRGFLSLGHFGLWWTSTDFTPSPSALASQLPSDDDQGHWGLGTGFAVKTGGGLSVRCVKDN